MITHVGIVTEASAEDLLGRSRKREALEARQFFWYAMWLHGNMCFSTIARRCGVGSATVAHGIRKIVWLLQIGDPKITEWDVDLRRLF